ncbi:MAG: LysR family transcriptional regulator [Sneathiella sp.]|nr:LysR family transcriptional regulator [Sneathiella sp.]
MSYRLSDFDWDDLKFFLAVARSGTLRGGAESLHANHATVSRRLSSLEQAIGARLFDRSKEGLQLTQLGEELLPHILRIEDGITTASRVVAGRDAQPAGYINLSIPHFVAQSTLMEDLADFSRQYEEIQLNIVVTDAFVDLGRREADVTLRVAHEITDNVFGRRLLTYAVAVYSSAEYAKNMKDNGGKGLNWIGWNEKQEELTAPWVKQSPYPNATLRHRIKDGVLLYAMATAGMGLAYLPCFMADHDPKLTRLPFQKPKLDRSIWLLLHSDLSKTARIRLLVDFLFDRIKHRHQEFTMGIGC